jgi:hypothetical protein
MAPTSAALVFIVVRWCSLVFTESWRFVFHRMASTSTALVFIVVRWCSLNHGGLCFTEWRHVNGAGVHCRSLVFTVVH